MYNPGKQLKKIRQYVGLTQEELAGKLGIKRNNISMIESGRNNPTFDLIYSICGVFNITADYFLTADDPSTYETLNFVKDDIKNTIKKNINNDNSDSYPISATNDYLNSKGMAKNANNNTQGVDLTTEELEQGLNKLIQSNLIYLEFHLSDILLNLKFLSEKITGKTFDRTEYDERSKSIKNLVKLLKDTANSGHASNKGLFNFLLNSDEAMRMMLDKIKEQSKELLINS